MKTLRSVRRRGHKFHLYEQGPLYLLMLPAIIHLTIFSLENYWIVFQ